MQFHGVLDHGLNLHWNIPLKTREKNRFSTSIESEFLM